MRGRGWARRLLVILSLLALAGCAYGEETVNDGGELVIPQNALDPAPGSIAQVQDALWDLVAPIALGVALLIGGLILFALWRFRSSGSDDEPLPKQLAGNTKLEIGWTALPALVLAGVAIPTVSTIFELATESPDAMNVRVVAKQYWWEFEYEDPEQEGVVTATQLHIPTGREVQLDMQSVSSQVSYDPVALPEGVIDPDGPVSQGVIHSFWVPRLAGKMDVVPGHTREMKIQTDEAGLYLGQCAEFCGLSHANMRFSVLAQSPEDFDAWIASQAEPAEPAEDELAALGEELFVSRTCLGCHAIDGQPQVLDGDGELIPLDEQPRIGPVLTHFNSRDVFAGIFDVDDDDALRAWLADPQAAKPGAQMPDLGLSDDDVDALVAYLRTLD